MGVVKTLGHSQVWRWMGISQPHHARENSTGRRPESGGGCPLCAARIVSRHRARGRWVEIPRRAGRPVLSTRMSVATGQLGPGIGSGGQPDLAHARRALITDRRLSGSRQAGSELRDSEVATSRVRPDVPLPPYSRHRWGQIQTSACSPISRHPQASSSSSALASTRFAMS
jgi:hypothetical protein